MRFGSAKALQVKIEVCLSIAGEILGSDQALLDNAEAGLVDEAAPEPCGGGNAVDRSSQSAINGLLHLRMKSGKRADELHVGGATYTRARRSVERKIEMEVSSPPPQGASSSSSSQSGSSSSSSSTSSSGSNANRSAGSSSLSFTSSGALSANRSAGSQAHCHCDMEP